MKQILTSNNITIVLLLILTVRFTLFPLLKDIYLFFKRMIKQKRENARQEKIKFLLSNFKQIKGRLDLPANKRNIKELVDKLKRKGNAKIKKASTKIIMHKTRKKVVLAYTINIFIEIEGRTIHFSNYYEAGEWNKIDNTFKGKYKASQIYKDFFHHVLISIADDSYIHDKGEILLYLLYDRVV